jgi:hypothetical protein
VDGHCHTMYKHYKCTMNKQACLHTCHLCLALLLVCHAHPSYALLCRWMFWGFFCAYLAVGAFFNLLLMMLCYQQHRFSAPARNVLLCQVCYMPWQCMCENGRSSM